ncbi:MAG: aldehyde dehydrogenase family protein [Chloroflexota bacterium]|nr:aldehyde dehydrogenase family protein [Chloroflexota bacterium]
METAIQSMKMYIGGAWMPSSSQQTFTTINPANQEPLAELPRGTAEDVDRAVKAARAAFESSEWSMMVPAQRGRLLLAMAERLRRRSDELARLETLDNGKPLSQSKVDVEVAARYCEYYAGVADKIFGETIPIMPGILDYTLREPIGISVQIVPWNYPLQIAMRGIAPALATGNAVILKPAEDTSLTALKLAEIAEEVALPGGIFNVVTGFGEVVGAALTAHPDVDHITFTGSVPTGIAVMKAAAENVKPVTLELGGKSPNIVFADADLDEATNWVVRSITQNAGQTCSAGSRLLVEQSIHDELVSRVARKMESLALGPGMEDPDLGPIISEQQLRTILHYLDLAKQEGVTIVTGGERADGDGLAKGFFLRPTVLDNLAPDHRLAQEEIFGPVLSVLTFTTVEEAIKIANGTEYGLIAAVWTNDLNKAHWVASKVKAGQVYINTYGAGGGVEMPFGGYGKSGFGREKGLEALRNYTQVKNVALRLHMKEPTQPAGKTAVKLE